MASNTIVRIPNRDILDVPASSEMGVPGVPSGYRVQAPANDGLPWRQFINVLRKHWKLSLGFLLAAEIGLALVVFSLDNVYQSHATLEVEAPAAENMSLNGGSSPTVEQQQYLDTQTQILRGDSLAIAVIDELHLGDNAAFLKQSWIQKLPGQIMGVISSRRSGSSSQTEKLLEIYKGQFN